MRWATMLSTRVAMNRVNPRPKADRVLALLNSWSPVSSVTIWTVTVVTVSSGLKVRLAARPAAMVTIMVSPIARDMASSRAPAMPGRAAGRRTRFTVSDLVAPMAKEPSRRVWGTAFRMSSDREETKGISMIPITAPAVRAIWFCTRAR